MNKLTLDIEPAGLTPHQVPIPEREIEAVRRMSSAERRTWLNRAVRKRRNKNKAARKARRRARR